eukprot:4153745-Amphidinium_carterae.1
MLAWAIATKSRTSPLSRLDDRMGTDDQRKRIHERLNAWRNQRVMYLNGNDGQTLAETSGQGQTLASYRQSPTALGKLPTSLLLTWTKASFRPGLGLVTGPGRMLGEKCFNLPW